MKKLLILFVGLLLFTVIGCKDDETVAPTYSIVGTWMPIKMVETTVTNNTNPVSDTFVYTDCEKESRWIFNEDNTGQKIIKRLINNQCVEWENETFTYTFDASTGDITINYITFQDKGKLFDILENSMNFRIEESTPNVYHSETYTLVKVGAAPGTGNPTNPSPSSKKMKQVKVQDTGDPAYFVNYVYNGDKLTSVNSSDNSISYTVDYTGNQITKITGKGIQGDPDVVFVSNLVYTGGQLTQTNGTRTDGAAVEDFITNYTYNAGKIASAVTTFYQAGTTTVTGTITGTFQHSGNNLTNWTLNLQGMIPLNIVTTFSNFDSKHNPFNTLPLEFNLANCNLDLIHSGASGFSSENALNMNVAGTGYTVNYTYDADNYPTKIVSPDTTLDITYY